jgi:hypothetical protein
MAGASVFPAARIIITAVVQERMVGRAEKPVREPDQEVARIKG